jgi:hypothetical protein
MHAYTASKPLTLVQHYAVMLLCAGKSAHEQIVRTIQCATQLDRGLPDYVVAAEAFDVRRRHTWTPGSRFRMYFGGKKGGPTKRSGARLAAIAYT